MKKKIITAVVLLVFGICAILSGVFLNKFSHSDDVSAFTDDSIGKTVKLCTGMDSFFPVDEQNGIYYTDEVNVQVIVPDEHSMEIDAWNLYETAQTITGTVKKATPEMMEETANTLISYYEELEEYMDYKLTDDDREYIRTSISAYYVEATATNLKTENDIRTILYVAGSLLLLSSVVFWISAFSRKSAAKIALVFAGIAVLLAIVIFALFYKKFGHMSNIRKDGEGVYYMEYNEELPLDELLAAGITSDEELLDWINKTEFHGLLPVNVDPERYGCASFAATTPDGDILFGRNFDYPETDTVMIYTHPENGYASYAIADLDVIGVSRRHQGIDPDSPVGRLIMTATPYIVCDGVNEAGLGISILELDIGEIHQDTGRPDLFIYTAIRVILDKCATVDEAIRLLEQYDIHSHNDVRHHLFIADKTGRSVVIEWFDNEMYVNELNAVTNSVLTPGDHYGEESDWRLPVLIDGLAAHNNILTAEQARDLLNDVSQGTFTEWSAVYNLSDFSVDLYVDRHYEHPYHYG